MNLPSAASQNGNTLFVNNGSSATDCTVGGGLYLVPCRSNGSAWSVQSTSGSSAWSALTSGTNTTGAFLIGTGASLGPTGTGTIKATGVLASAGPTPTADGAIAYDTTNLWYAAGLGSATVKFPWWNGTLGSGNCAQWSGTGGHLIDSGSPCGSGSGITQLTLTEYITLSWSLIKQSFALERRNRREMRRSSCYSTRWRFLRSSSASSGAR